MIAGLMLTTEAILLPSCLRRGGIRSDDGVVERRPGRQYLRSNIVRCAFCTVRWLRGWRHGNVMWECGLLAHTRRLRRDIYKKRPRLTRRGLSFNF